jgi:Ala-tRNA(Pro) deacylase
MIFYFKNPIFKTNFNFYNMSQKEKVLQILNTLKINYELHEHPPAPTIEEAMKYWKDIDATHCKNLFFRNHKGNLHYLVILDHLQALDIHDLEKKLKQGKISFASDQRMMKYLGLTPGSVSIFGLINDAENHVHVFIDESLKKSSRISFHPNINTASLIISFEDFERFLKWSGNGYEYLSLGVGK